MQVVNGKEKEVIGMLGAYGLGGYEARMYFTLLALGKGKAIEITRKASVLQSKAYTVLDSLIDKGFVELSGTDRPKVTGSGHLKRPQASR